MTGDVPALRVGISGWSYPHWRGDFYPAGLVQRRELEYVGRRMNSAEINGSFYSLQRPTSYARWRDATPPGFTFAVKGGRYITHMKKLRDVDRALANFFASGPLALGPKLGPFLWQLPAATHFHADTLDGFLSRLPRDTAELAALGAGHEERMAGRVHLAVDEVRPVRHAMEVRHASFESPEAIDIIRAHGVALVLADTAGVFPMPWARTADFCYLRLHGAQQLYVSGYNDDSIGWWAQYIRDQNCDTYVYFDNDGHGHAPYDAMRLAAALGIHPLGEVGGWF